MWDNRTKSKASFAGDSARFETRNEEGHTAEGLQTCVNHYEIKGGVATVAVVKGEAPCVVRVGHGPSS